MEKTIYLAGPEVFLPDSQEIGARKQALCRAHGMIGLYPGDNGPFDSSLTPAELSRVIFETNLALMRRADLFLGNLTPFRGPGADAGTVWELGFMAGLSKPVYGYSNSPATLLERTRVFDPASRHDPGTGSWLDSRGLVIEDLDGGDNLMIIESLRLFGGTLVTPATAPEDPDRDLAAFEACLRRLKSDAITIDGIPVSQAPP